MASSCSDNKKWQVKMRTLSDSAAFLFDNQTMSDVKFVFNKETSDSTSIHAHSWLLSMLSPVFYESFKDNFEVNKEIPVSDASHAALMECLRFIYTSKCILTCENVFEIMAVAQKYSLEFLKNDCMEFISNSITVDSACQYLENSILIKQNSLKDKTISFISREIGSIFNSKFFMNIKKETLDAILRINETGPFNEFEIYTGTMKWAAQQCASNQMAVNGENKRRVLGDLLKLIRFPTMTHVELAHCVNQEKGLLMPDEAKELFLEVILDEKNNMGFSNNPRKQTLYNVNNLKETDFEIGDAIDIERLEPFISEIRSKFTVNHTVWLTQIHFSQSSNMSIGTVELIDDTNLTINREEFSCYENTSLLACPLILNPGREYTIYINYENRDQDFYLCEPKDMPWSDIKNGIEFRFSELSRLLCGLSFKYKS